MDSTSLIFTGDIGFDKYMEDYRKALKAEKIVADE